MFVSVLSSEDGSMDQKTLIRWLKEQPNLSVRPTAGSHLGVYRKGQRVATIPATPHKGQHCVRNTMSLLRRLGIDVPHRGQKK